jgi:uncharacterized protein
MMTTPDYQVYYRIRVAPSKIDGKGAFAQERIPARKKIGDLGGVVISIKEANAIALKTKRVAMVELSDTLALNASVNSNELRYINHSCQPNAYIRVLGKRVEFYALKNIKPGEEITSNYGETHHEGTLKCRCGKPGCVGYL